MWRSRRPTSTTFLISGGNFVPACLDQVTWWFIANLSNAGGSVVFGTGQFASATGTFRVSASVTVSSRIAAAKAATAARTRARYST